MQLGEVRREGHVVELAAVEPGIEAAERAGVGPPGVRADGGLDQAARGRRRPPDHGLFGVGPGGLIIHVKGNAHPIIRLLRRYVLRNYFGGWGVGSGHGLRGDRRGRGGRRRAAVDSPGHAARHCGVVPHVLTGQMISAVNTRIDNILLADRKA